MQHANPLRYFLLGDGGDEMQGIAQNTRTLIWDVTEVDDPVLLTEYFGPTKAVDHNMYVRGNLVFQANYDAGLRVIDISDIEHPREVGHFDTAPEGRRGSRRPKIAVESALPHLLAVRISFACEGARSMPWSDRVSG
jgi:choice-of-anchor B domain-containing protein